MLSGIMSSNVLSAGWFCQAGCSWGRCVHCWVATWPAGVGSRWISEPSLALCSDCLRPEPGPGRAALSALIAKPYQFPLPPDGRCCVHTPSYWPGSAPSPGWQPHPCARSSARYLHAGQPCPWVPQHFIIPHFARMGSPVCTSLHFACSAPSWAGQPTCKC